MRAHLGRLRVYRDDQAFLAASAGLRVKSNVSGRLDVLVLADAESQSGKAREAAELGVRRMAEPVNNKIALKGPARWRRFHPLLRWRPPERE